MSMSATKSFVLYFERPQLGRRLYRLYGSLWFMREHIITHVTYRNHHTACCTSYIANAKHFIYISFTINMMILLCCGQGRLLRAAFAVNMGAKAAMRIYVAVGSINTFIYTQICIATRTINYFNILNIYILICLLSLKVVYI